MLVENAVVPLSEEVSLGALLSSGLIPVPEKSVNADSIAAEEECPFPSEKAPKLEWELSWELNHSSPSLAFNPVGIGVESALSGTMSSTVRSRQPGRRLLALFSPYVVFL